jgi:hypothetical protein
LKGESKELSVADGRHLLDDVDRARTERGEERGIDRRRAREVAIREAIVRGGCCGQLDDLELFDLRFLRR